MLRTSERGIAFIKRFEDFVKYAYYDFHQYSIGYGSHCDRTDYPNGITQEEADELLRLELETEMEPVIEKVERTRGKKFTQSEWDALASLEYNLGSQWVDSGYNIYKYIIGEYPMDEQAFIDTFKKWNNAGNKERDGLTVRREAEARLFLYGEYGDGKPNEKGDAEMRFDKLKDIKDADARKTITKLLNLSHLRGKGGSGEDTIIDLGEDAIRVLVVLDRAGVFDKKTLDASSVDLTALGKIIYAELLQRITNG